ncbi:hypothetical protein GCM10008960_29840 [Deinococcus sedimenti]|uniref:Methyltransferase domain-containing protein n=1 Tax=Deinococcus sedimenti TaxID=1867090 RepID=A0ABQ2S620_9DEIO|nr:hypothetical protein GCM10008960_29840 [Deinococcus sedimenti]
MFAAWAAQVRAAPSGRADPARDVAFWARQAAHYDAGQPALPNTVAWLRGRLRGARSLLDVGAGTGRLTLPLAPAVPLVTALDHSPDMLAVLRAKGPPAHLSARCQGLQDALRDPTLPPHDAVLSAWSLAYLPDLRAALSGLLRLSGRDLLILEDDGVGSPHVNLRRHLSGQPRPQRASQLNAALSALGHPPDHHRVQEARELTFPDLPALLAQARLPLPDAEALAALRPHLTHDGAGWRYRWTFDVHVLHVRMGARP